MKNYNSAITDFDKAIKLDTGYVLAYNKRGLAKRYKKDYVGAILDYDKAIKLDSEFAIAYNNRGVAKSDLEDYEGAIEDYDIAIKIDSKYKRAFNNRGYSKRKLNDFDGALLDYNTAINLDQKYSLPWEGKFAVYFYQNKLILALNCLLRASYLGQNQFKRQDILYSKHPFFPFFIYRQIQKNLQSNQYSKYVDTIKLAIKQCLPIYTYITYQVIQQTKYYEKDLWQRMLGAINYYCGDPIVSYKIFKSFLYEDSKTLSGYYYLIQSCYDFVEDADPYIGKAILIAEKVRDETYEHPSVGNTTLSFPILQQYYAGLIFEIDEEPKDALTCFEKIAAYFLPAKYKQMQLLYDLDNREASERIRRSILEDENKLDQTKGFSKGLKTHVFNLATDRIEKVFPHYFHYLEIDSAIKHFVEKSEYDVNYDMEYPGFQLNFWELFKVNPNDLEQTRIRANADELLKQYEIQIEEYGQSFDSINLPSTIETNIDFKQTFKSLKDLPKEELLTDLGLHAQKFEHSIKQYEELSTYFMLKGDLTHYEKLLLDFYAAMVSSNQKSTSESGLAGVGEVIENYVSEYLSQLSMLVAGAITKLSPLVSAMLGASGQIFAIFAAGALAELFKIYYQRLQTPKIPNFIDFKKDFEWTIAQEKERLGDKFEKRYPIQELYK